MAEFPVEYDRVIEPLTKPAGAPGAPAFHVVVPSMPGYGFSDKPRERGYNPERMAQVWATLMARLGYSRYIVHGSDWGISVATYLALADSAHISGLHLAGCPGGAIGPPPPPTPGAPPPRASSNLGYQEIQTTKPQTLGQGLSDSPLGLASWIIDKWHSWSDHDGDLEKVYTKDDLLTNIMFYWVTNSGTSSARLYYESRHVDGVLQPTFFATFMPPMSRGKVTVPTGCGAFPSQYDNRGLPINRDPALARKSAETRYNVVHLTIAPERRALPGARAAAGVDGRSADVRARPDGPLTEQVIAAEDAEEQSGSVLGVLCFALRRNRPRLSSVLSTRQSDGWGRT